jgi:hypothetical protein
VRLDEALCNACQTTADNLGFGPEIEAESLLEEPLWDHLVGNLCERCQGKVALAIGEEKLSKLVERLAGRAKKASVRL